MTSSGSRSLHSGVGAILVATIGINGLYRGPFTRRCLSSTISTPTQGRAGAMVWARSRKNLMYLGSLDNRLEGVPGVREARRFIEFKQNSSSSTASVSGITIVGTRLSQGPRRVANADRWPSPGGRALRGDRDKSLGAVVGDVLRLGRDDYSVVRIVSAVDPGGDPWLFVTIVDAQAIDLFALSEAVLLNRQSRSLSPNPSAQRQCRRGGARTGAAILRPYGQSILRWGDVSVLSREEERNAMLNGASASPAPDFGVCRHHVYGGRRRYRRHCFQHDAREGALDRLAQTYRRARPRHRWNDRKAR